MAAAPQTISADASSEIIEIGLEAGEQPALLAFASDQDTAERLAEFCRTRRFAARIGPRGIAGAAEYLTKNPPVELLLVDLDGVSDPMAAIDSLAEVCDPGTAVIAIGSTNDVTLYRQLLDAGLSDYLIKPLKAGSLLHAVEKASRPVDSESTPHSLGVVSVFVGARGGVGGSTIAVNTAWQLAQRGDGRAMLIDLDLHFGTAALALDLEPGRGLREMLENPARIDSMFIASAASGADAKLHVLGAEEPLDVDAEFSDEAIQRLLDEVRKSYDHIIIELPRSMVIRMRHLLSTATSVVLVSDLSLGGMRDTMRLLDLVRQEAPKARRQVVVNRVGADKKHELPRNEFERGIEEKISFMVPEDAKSVKQALVAGKALKTVAKGCKVVTVLDKLSEELAVKPNDAEEDGDDKKKGGKGWQFWSKE
ncbi:MAG: AAA family ATPase [Alphaproteobacteria bacterium]|nr:AAA family ATPase [Alphaproteobacteria bacterium]